MTSLCAVVRKKKKDNKPPVSSLRPTLFLVSLPLLSILGTQLVNSYNNNVLLLILIPLIALVPILVAFDKFIPRKLYPLATTMIAISLLYHTSLISTYLVGVDVHHEYYFAHLVKCNSAWNSNIPDEYNAMLSIVMLAPIYSEICGASLVWVFKVVYPLLYSLVPLGLYKVFQKQYDSKMAFLATFFFMSMFTFFDEMISLARQQIAELFLVLLMFLIVNKEMNKIKRVILLIVFSASLVISHYGLSYIFMFSLIPVLFLLLFINRGIFRRLYLWRALKNKAITPVFVALYCTLSLSWYTYISGSYTFNLMVSIIDRIAKNIFTGFFNPEAAQGLNILLSKTASPLHDVYKVLHILMQFFITVGLLHLLLASRKKRFDEEYVSFSLVSFVWCLLAISVPYLANALNTTRLYHVTLIFLAPFSVTGTIATFKFFSRIQYSISKKASPISKRTSLKALSILLAIFLLFNSELVFELTKDHPYSFSLSQKWIKQCGDAEGKFWFNSMVTPVKDIVSARWLSQQRDNTLKIYSDFRARNNALNAYAMISRSEGLVIYNNTKGINERSYIYLREVNIVEGLMGPNLFNATTILSLLPQKTNKIYSNGGSEIYYTVQPVIFEIKD